MRSVPPRSRSRAHSWSWWWLVPLFILAHGLTVGTSGCGRSELEPLGSGSVGSGGRGGSGMSGAGGTSVTQLPPTPGLLLCGTTICVANVQQCCLGLGSSGLDGQCVAPGTSCPGATVQCDEPADCPSPKVCCAGLLSGSSTGSGASTGSLIPGISLGSRCEARASCTGAGELIVCRSNSDCGVGAVCCPGLGVATCQTSCTAF